MAFSASTGSVTSGTPPTAIFLNETGSRVGLSYSIRNTGDQTIYLGGSDVNATDKGFPLLAGESMAINLNKTDTLYARTASGVMSTYALLKQDD
ncbi:hypothetical protein GTQ99_00305 [Kineococcus sp. T13]|uniref:hypothetical protein n=1 Tax=Kineococcus vitellinus TaxID=2696565 RepID=UPI001412AF71|nr:hypothetical protein [Kineococcus vitellinus]NAZ73872.1 hypothetical protein [Kineococcus vitellinus]